MCTLYDDRYYAPSPTETPLPICSTEKAHIALSFILLSVARGALNRFLCIIGFNLKGLSNTHKKKTKNRR